MLINNEVHWFVFFLLATGGLGIGSFLNVVAARLPIMLQHYDDQEEVINLVKPRSRCPKCHHTLQLIDLIPLVSYLYLRGRCRHCQQSIDIQYLGVELVTAVIVCLPFYLLTDFGQAALVATAGCLLLVLAIIDFGHLWLPNVLTLPLLLLGLLANTFGFFVNSQQAIVDAIAGFLSLLIIQAGFKLITDKTGMGGGDLKLLAATGAWLGWQALPSVLLVASTSGLLFWVLMTLATRPEFRKGQAMAFGPWLALGFWPQFFLA